MGFSRIRMLETNTMGTMNLDPVCQWSLLTDRQVLEQPRVRGIAESEAYPAWLTLVSAQCVKSSEEVRDQEAACGAIPNMFPVSSLQSVRAWWILLDIGYMHYEMEGAQGTVKNPKHCKWEFKELDRRIAAVRSVGTPKSDWNCDSSSILYTSTSQIRIDFSLVAIINEPSPKDPMRLLSLDSTVRDRMACMHISFYMESFASRTLGLGL